MTWLRAMAAAGLSLFFPGAGHALLRDWFRALVFAGLYFSAVWFFFPVEQMASASSFSGMMDVVNTETDTMSQFFIMFIALFAAIDATFRALGFPPESNDQTDGPSCPECGKGLDEDLGFCHWCTTRLEPVDSEAEDVDETEREEPVHN
ncbi:hypothetical protein SAMN04487967_0849 [Natronorubrum sediminis]|uniref:DUF7575 domain-containing protein n=1 Tax=Natronorubrum sediminis TaxID=640943 RepID=A0A1H6FNP5_9EURY|nr:zinc ribbon domain-containing protein [Natronorubrum sediminis]SEH12527.1 hypothetical protein SAMN04487967_0849 [Natronorubrum sediminis]